MLEQLHKAAQYLAAAGISFVEQAADDSHTNLGWDEYKQRLLSRSFGESNYQLALNYSNFSLEWMENGESAAIFLLDDRSHAEALKWIREKCKASGIDIPYNYQFHYDLPYGVLSTDFQFKVSKYADLKALAYQLSTAKRILSGFMDTHQLEGEIRVWPHHFDMGIYVNIDVTKGLFMGAGLAIPDTVENQLYFYATGWDNGKAIPIANFSTKKIGKWNTALNGATMSAADVSVELGIDFFTETMSDYLTKK